MKAKIIDGLIIIVSIAFACFCGVAFAYEYGAWAAALCIGMVIGIFAADILHETGHIVFGALVKIGTKPFFGLVRPSGVRIIPKTDKNLRARIVFTAFGGIAVNFLFVALGIVALCVSAVPTALALFAPGAFYLFALNVLPLDLPDGKTDGLIISEVIKSDDNAKVLLAVLAVQAQILGGKPIEEIDPKLLFDLPQIQEDDESFIALTELRYEYYKARGDAANAEKSAKRLEELKVYLSE